VSRRLTCCLSVSRVYWNAAKDRAVTWNVNARAIRCAYGKYGVIGDPFVAETSSWKGASGFRARRSRYRRWSRQRRHQCKSVAVACPFRAVEVHQLYGLSY
jgi:hypothetical protein